MSQTTITVFAIAIALLIMQSVFGFFQIKNYQATLKKLHKQGNVGIGQRKGAFFSSHIVMIVCDNTTNIVTLEVLDGISLLAKFTKKESLLGEAYAGKNIYHFLQAYNNLDPKQAKKHQGYIRALQALELRLKKT